LFITAAGDEANETPSCPSDIRPRSVDIVLDEAFTETQ